MRRGFLGSPARSAPVSAQSPINVVQSVTSSSDNDRAASYVAVSKDYTAIYDDSTALILQSDYRLERSPFFGYFPPGSKEPSMVYIDSEVERIESAIDWSIWNEPGLPEVAESARCFEIKDVEGKGKAMIARRDIPAGTLIWKEIPFYVSIQTKNIAPDQGLKSGLFHRSAASRLGVKQRRALLALSNCYEPEMMDEIPGKLGTNYLPVDITARPDPAQQEKFCGAFAVLSRANHVCNPNTNFFFHFPDFTGRFYSMRDIRAGEEITIMYTDTLGSRATRRDSLLESHLFVCKCTFCSLPREAAKISDVNRAFLKAMVDRLSTTDSN